MTIIDHPANPLAISRRFSRQPGVRAIDRADNRMEATKLSEDWTPERLLQAWGTAQHGRLLTPGPRVSKGAAAGSDDEKQAAWYVEHVAGFSVARPILSWVYSEYQPITAFRLQGPGETILRALLRLGWAQYCNRTSRAIPCWVHDDFYRALVEAERASPFCPVREADDDETVEQVRARQNSTRDLVA